MTGACATPTPTPTIATTSTLASASASASASSSSSSCVNVDDWKRDKTSTVIVPVECSPPLSSPSVVTIPSHLFYPTIDDISPIWAFLLCIAGIRYSPTWYTCFQWIRSRCCQSIYHHDDTIHSISHHHKSNHISMDTINQNNNNTETTCDDDDMRIRHLTSSHPTSSSSSIPSSIPSSCRGTYSYTIYSYLIHLIFIGIILALHTINNDWIQIIAGLPGMIAWTMIRSIIQYQQHIITPIYQITIPSHTDTDTATHIDPYYYQHSTHLYRRIRYIIYACNLLIASIALALIIFFGIIAQRWSITTLVWNIYTITLVGIGYIYFLITIVILYQQTSILLYYIQIMMKHHTDIYIQNIHQTYQACCTYVERVGRIWSIPVAAACLLFIWAFIFGVREYVVKGSYGGLPWLLIAPFMFVCVVGPILWLNLVSCSSNISRTVLCLILSHPMYHNDSSILNLLIQSIHASSLQLSICGITPTAALLVTSIAGPIVAVLWNSGQAFITKE